jgi:predicted metal-binding membrane protein
MMFATVGGTFSLLSLLNSLHVFIAVPARVTRDAARLDPLPRERNVILVLLLALAIAAWAVLVWQHDSANMDLASPAMAVHAPLFLAMWVLMMVAMMFPTAAPMILTYHRVQAGRHQADGAFVSTWVFAIAYLLVWALAGTAAYAGVLVTEAVAVRHTLGPATASQIGGAIVMVAGIYQLTPLKEISLSKCRRPIRFILASWHDGTAGALRMGLLHGVYCVGCCWFLFTVLFPLGMNVGTMGAITLIIFAEKSLPWPTLVRYTTAVLLVVYGALVIASVQPGSSATMPAEMKMQMQVPGGGNTSTIK